MQVNFYVFVLTQLVCSVIKITGYSDSIDQFDVTIRSPIYESSWPAMPFKSVHIGYTPSYKTESWTIVAIESFIRNLNDSIQLIRVHVCREKQMTLIWHNDRTSCNGGKSMLIYQWSPNISLTKFRISDDLGFRVDHSNSIVLSIFYANERLHSNDKSGVTLTISTLNPRFHVGTVFVGSSQQTTQFSCRTSNYPRLLYAVKSLFPQTNQTSWAIYVVRVRQFGRKLVQHVLDNLLVSKTNLNEFELVTSDIFLNPGDYILIQCLPNVGNNDCQFLIYYTYKNLQYKYFDDDDSVCQNDKYPNLFKLIPLETNQITPQISTIDGKTVFLLLCLLLLLIWISIIIGCVIMRRIRGLVNFRSEPITPQIGQQNKFRTNPAKQAQENALQQRIATEADHTAQLDIEHMGLMS